LAPPPDPVANVPAVVSETPPIVAVKKRRRPLRAPVPEPAPTETPIVQVLDLLKNRESLASAFLLREILAAPVSKRGSSDAKL
jgi:hypothetical protein